MDMTLKGKGEEDVPDYGSLQDRVRKVIDSNYDKYGKRTDEMWLDGRRDLTVDFTDIYDVDEELGRMVIRKPEEALQVFSDVFTQWVNTRPGSFEEVNRLTVRLQNHPEETGLRQVIDRRVGFLVCVTGVVVQASPVFKHVDKAYYRCTCGEGFNVPQNHRLTYLKKPDKCPFCGKHSGFRLDRRGTRWIKSQRLVIQERTEDIPPGEGMPRTLKLILKEEIVDAVAPGDRVRVIGILDTEPVERNSLDYSTLLLANNIEKISSDEEVVQLSREDVGRVKELADDPNIIDNLIDSLAPGVHGYRDIKEAILYQLMGSDSFNRGNTRVRGDIHVLLIGDPSTCKSQLLMLTAELAPRGLFTTGRGSTAAGLTATAVKEKDGWMLQAGALVLADKGVCCIDEIEKMSENDRGAIHPAMAQQKVAVSKAGINQELPSRAAILASANPTHNRYNPYTSVADNLKKLPITLLTRFDLIFLIRDIADPERDRELARFLRRKPDEPPLNRETFMKYVSYAKDNISPELTEEAGEMLEDFYLKMRSTEADLGEVAPIAITARQYESLLRLAKARARCMLREKATTEDAEAVIRLMKVTLSQVGIDPETGEYDIDMLETGTSRTMQEKLEHIHRTIRDMQRDLTQDMVEKSKLYDTLLDEGLEKTEIKRLLGTLMDEGIIFQPRPGYYKT